jgi:hypothetical protein
MPDLRTCIFCGTTPLSREHIWPEWLMRLLPTPDGVETTAQRGFDQPIQFWRSRRPEQTARFVCAACNNGWMSQLENAMKQVVTSILSRPSSIIDASAQGTIALWAVKTAMVYEALRPNREWFYRADERHSFRLDRQIPDRTYVWIAPLVATPGFYSTATDMWETHAKTAEETQGYVTTMAFGSLAIQILTIRIGSNRPADLVLSVPCTNGPWNDSTIPVHPRRRDSEPWPTRVRLQGEGGVSFFAERWKTDGARTV